MLPLIITAVVVLVARGVWVRGRVWVARRDDDEWAPRVVGSSLVIPLGRDGERSASRLYTLGRALEGVDAYRYAATLYALAFERHGTDAAQRGLRRCELLDAVPADWGAVT